MARAIDVGIVSSRYRPSDPRAYGGVAAVAGSRVAGMLADPVFTGPVPVPVPDGSGTVVLWVEPDGAWLITREDGAVSVEPWGMVRWPDCVVRLRREAFYEVAGSMDLGVALDLVAQGKIVVQGVQSEGMWFLELLTWLQRVGTMEETA